MFVSKKRRNVFRKRSTIKACEAGFRELEKFGYEFGPFGFAGRCKPKACNDALRGLANHEVCKEVPHSLPTSMVGFCTGTEASHVLKTLKT